MGPSSTPVEITTTVETTDKPGWKTTEFWFASGVKLLGVLLASGAIGHGTIWETLIGGALTVLAQFGYTAARVAIKTAPLALVLMLAASQLSCATAKEVAADARIAGRGVLECVKLQAKSLEAEMLDIAYALGKSEIGLGKPNWKLIGSEALTSGTVLAVCAYASYWSLKHPAPQPVPAGSEVTAVARTAPDETLETIRARYVPGGVIRTRYGDL